MKKKENLVTFLMSWLNRWVKAFKIKKTDQQINYQLSTKGNVQHACIDKRLKY